MRTTLTASIALMTACGAASAGINLLSNASFEMGTNFDGNDMGNWNSFFGGAPFQMAESITPIAAALDGMQVLQIGSTGQANTFVGATQTVAVSAGTEYEFSINARLAPLVQPLGADAEFRIEWKDAMGGVIGDPFALNTNITGAVTDDWQGFSVSDFAPAGATQATVVIAVQTFNGSAAPHEGFYQFDATSFGVIPAPASAALLGMGLVGAARRRR